VSEKGRNQLDCSQAHWNDRPMRRRHPLRLASPL
jgi:hypothetical protein